MRQELNASGRFVLDQNASPSAAKNGSDACSIGENVAVLEVSEVSSAPRVSGSRRKERKKKVKNKFARRCCTFFLRQHVVGAELAQRSLRIRSRPDSCDSR